MKSNQCPSNRQMQEADRANAIDEAVNDCACIARLISNELARDIWNVQDQELEALHYLSRKLAGQIEELKACIAS